MERNPCWAGAMMALSDYPLVRALARKAQENAREEERRRRLSASTDPIPQGLLETKAVSTALAAAGEVWGRQPKFVPISLPRPPGRKPASAPVGERLPNGQIVSLLRADPEGELNTGLFLRSDQRLSIDVQGNCRLSPTLLTNPGGIELRDGIAHGNPIFRPDAAYPDAPCGSVVALVGSAHWAVKGHWEGHPACSGVLRLAVNDVPGLYQDNRAPGGEIVVLAVAVRV